MATLIDRVLGLNDVNPDSPPEEARIGVGPFIAGVSEVLRGDMTQVEFKNIHNLQGQQIQDAQYFADLAAAAPDVPRFFQMFEYLAWLGADDDAPIRYRGQAYLKTRLEQEIIDQGGTLP